MKRLAGGVTMVELTVGILLASIFVFVGYRALGMLGRGEKSSDRQSTRALLEARLLERLLRDLRSATAPVERLGDGTYKISRSVLVNGAMENCEVLWKVVPGADGPRVVREETGASAQEFRFSGLLDPGAPPFRFHIEKVPDALFPL